MKRLALIFAAALLALPVAASAHTAVTTCGGSIELAKGSATVDIIRTDVDPDVLVYDDAPGNGVLAVEPGTYKAAWSDGYVVRGLIVTACAQSEPTPTPTPTPTPEPTPTPSPEATPTPTPCAFPHTPPEPCTTPVPEPTQPCEAGPPAFDCGPFDTPRPNPRPTPPETDTASSVPSAAEYVVFLLAAVAGGALLLTGMANRKRTR